MITLDWKLAEAKKLTVGDLLRLASNLKSEDGENPEYDRALVEIVADALALPCEFKSDIIKRLGITSKVY